MTDLMNIPEIETLEYHSPLCKCPECKRGHKPAQENTREHPPDIEPKTKVENKESVDQQLCKKCQVVNCSCRAVILKEPEQPKENAMIFVQVNGSITVALDLLKQLKSKDTHQEAQKQGCIWTLKGWLKNNLKHLQKEYE